MKGRDDPAPIDPPVTGTSFRILASLVGGLILGAVWRGGSSSPPIVAAAQQVGKLWLDALTMTVVPLVFSLLVTGIISAAGSVAPNRIVPRAMLWFMALLAGACLLSALLTSLALDLWPVPSGAASIESPAAGGMPFPPVRIGCRTSSRPTRSRQRRTPRWSRSSSSR